MTRSQADLGGRDDPVELVLVDGTNLAFSLGRGGSGAGSRAPAEPSAAQGSRPPPAPVAGVLASLRAAFPPGTPIEVFFDGPPAGPMGRIATGLVVRYSGRRSADDLIAERVEAEVRVNGPIAAAAIVVLTDDSGLAGRIVRMGARARPAAFLGARAARLSASRGRPTRSPRPAPAPRAGASFGHRRPPRP